MKNQTLTALRNARGFTLIEIMVVVVIIGVLISLVAPSVTSYLNRASETAEKVNMKNIEGQLPFYRLDNGSYPTTAQGLRALMEQPSGATRWKGPYLQNLEPADLAQYCYISPAPQAANNQQGNQRNIHQQGYLLCSPSDSECISTYCPTLLNQ